MSDVNSTTPLGTENSGVVAGIATSSDAVLDVLSFKANVGDAVFVEIPAGQVGYWRTSDMINADTGATEYRPIPAAGLSATLPCQKGGSFKLQVKRIPSGADVSGIQAGRLYLQTAITH